MVRTWCVFVRFDNFSTFELQKVVRACSVLYILTWKCASRHSSVKTFDILTSKRCLNLVCFVRRFDLEMCFEPQQRTIFIFALATCLRTRRFSEPTLRPSWPTNHRKIAAIRYLPNISRLYLLSSDFRVPVSSFF